MLHSGWSQHASVLKRLAWAASAVRVVLGSVAALASVFAWPGLINSFHVTLSFSPACACFPNALTPSQKQQWNIEEILHPSLTQIHPTVLFTSEQKSSQGIHLMERGGLHNEEEDDEEEEEKMTVLRTFVAWFHLWPTILNKPSQTVVG